MGLIFEALARAGQLDNTLLIFTSDNGCLMGEHGQFGQKRWACEESIRIPFLVRDPKRIPAGSSREQMSLSVDVAPAAVELAGAGALGPMHGRSLLPVFRDDAAPLSDSFLAGHFVGKGAPKAPDWQAVRTGQWKYIHDPALEGMDELYDLRADPREIRHLASDAAQAELVGRVRGELSRRLESTGRPG